MNTNGRGSSEEIIVRAENIISPARILFLDSPAKREALLSLADNLAGAPQIKDSAELTGSLLEREELMSTAIGRGIAIPHVRLASVTDLVVSVGISRAGIPDFGALDEEPVRFILMIAAAYNQHAYYLKTLSFLSSRLKDRELQRSLLEAREPLDVYHLLVKGKP